MLRTTLLRASFFLALLLGVSAFPAESSGYNPNIEGSGTHASDETDRAKRDILIVQEEVILITDPQGSGDASGNDFSDMLSDLQGDEENIRNKRDVSDEGSGSEANATCTAFDQCYDDNDCNGGKCNGFALNTCDCNKCLQMSLCKEDEQCGGLRGACNNGLCDCYAAFAKHGYNDVLDAWSKLCNAKQCNKKTAALDCFGLPCNKGFCTC